MSQREPVLTMQVEPTDDYLDPRLAATAPSRTRYYLDEREITREEAAEILARWDYHTGDLP